MEIGPVEYVLISFPGNRFKGEIAPAIGKLVESGLIRILDLTFVKKDQNGSVVAFEYDELSETATFAAVDGEADGLLGNEDIAAVSEALEPNSSALLIVWEDRWASTLADALRAAGGQIVAGERIPHDVVVAAFADLDDASGQEVLA